MRTLNTKHSSYLKIFKFGCNMSKCVKGPSTKDVCSQGERRVVQCGQGVKGLLSYLLTFLVQSMICLLYLTLSKDATTWPMVLKSIRSNPPICLAAWLAERVKAPVLRPSWSCFDSHSYRVVASLDKERRFTMMIKAGLSG